jgi:hypothetical protein
VGVWLIHAHQRAPSNVHHHVNASPWRPSGSGLSWGPSFKFGLLTSSQVKSERARRHCQALAGSVGSATPSLRQAIMPVHATRTMPPAQGPPVPAGEARRRQPQVEAQRLRVRPGRARAFSSGVGQCSHHAKDRGRQRRRGPLAQASLSAQWTPGGTGRGRGPSVCTPPCVCHGGDIVLTSEVRLGG